MPTAMNLLSTWVCDDILTVDLESRQISIPDTVENLGVESDDSVRVLHFQVPRQYCDVDLSTFAIRVNYKNTSGAGGSYDIADFSIEEGMIKFDWLVERPVTVRRGNVVFNVCFREIINDVVEREFNTAIATLPVLEGLETGEEIVEEHLDILEQLMNNSVHVPADMTDNNPNSPAHIFNRTHWKEVEANVTFFNQTGINFGYKVAERIGLEIGGVYKAVYNDIIYDTVGVAYAYNGESGVILVKDDGRDRNQYDTGILFTYIEFSPETAGTLGYTGIVNPMDGSENVSLIITGNRTTWHKLDKRYLPDSVTELSLSEYGIDLQAIIDAGGSAVVSNTTLLWKTVSNAWQGGNRLRVSVPVGDTKLVFSDPSVCNVGNAGLCLLMNTMLTLDAGFVALYILLSPDTSYPSNTTARTMVYVKSVMLG